MYNTLKNWMDIPCSIQHCIGTNDFNDKVYADPISTLGYVEGSIKQVVDSLGDEVVSMSTVYIDGSECENLTTSDILSVEGVPRKILALNAFYAKGIVDIWVVYI